MPDNSGDSQYIRFLPSPSLFGDGSEDAGTSTCASEPLSDNDLRSTPSPSASIEVHSRPLESPTKPPTQVGGPELLAGGGHRNILTCVVCGKTFFRARIQERGHRHCCSLSCASTLGRAASHASYKTPESTKAERVRANGLVNKRLKLGWFKKPDHCCLCGQPHHRISAHHRDYSKPDHVHWVCPGCHLSIHHDDSKLDGIPPFVCDRQTPPPPRHSKGGRKGPTGKAKGRAPLMTINDFLDYPGGIVAEVLSCGHINERQDDGSRPKQRRCLSCRANARKERAA